LEHLNKKLHGIEFDEPQQLLCAILESLTEPTFGRLNQVFEEWMRIIQQSINLNGDHVEWALI
jgi:hypothetical protein